MVLKDYYKDSRKGGSSLSVKGLYSWCAYVCYVITGDPDQEVMAKCNVCYKNPCANSGTCAAMGFKVKFMLATSHCS